MLIYTGIVVEVISTRFLGDTALYLPPHNNYTFLQTLQSLTKLLLYGSFNKHFDSNKLINLILNEHFMLLVLIKIFQRLDIK